MSRIAQIFDGIPISCFVFKLLSIHFFFYVSYFPLLPFSYKILCRLWFGTLILKLVNTGNHQFDIKPLRFPKNGNDSGFIKRKQLLMLFLKMNEVQTWSDFKRGETLLYLLFVSKTADQIVGAVNANYVRDCSSVAVQLDVCLRICVIHYVEKQLQQRIVTIQKISFWDVTKNCSLGIFMSLITNNSKFSIQGTAFK